MWLNVLLLISLLFLIKHILNLNTLCWMIEMIGGWDGKGHLFHDRCWWMLFDIWGTVLSSLWDVVVLQFSGPHHPLHESCSFLVATETLVWLNVKFGHGLETSNGMTERVEEQRKVSALLCPLLWVSQKLCVLCTIKVTQNKRETNEMNKMVSVVFGELLFISLLSYVSVLMGVACSRWFCPQSLEPGLTFYDNKNEVTHHQMLNQFGKRSWLYKGCVH